MLEDPLGTLQSRLGDHTDQIVDSKVSSDRFVESRTPSAATRLPLGCGLTTNVLPAAIILMALPVIVGNE